MIQKARNRSLCACWITTKAKRKQKYDKNINILLGYREILRFAYGGYSRSCREGDANPPPARRRRAPRGWIDRPPPHPNPKGHITTCYRCKMSFRDRVLVD